MHCRKTTCLVLSATLVALVALLDVGIRPSSALAAGPVTGRQAARKVGKLAGVQRARTIGETQSSFKVSSQEVGGKVRVRWVSKATGRISKTSADLVPAAAKKVAAENPTGQVRAGDSTGRNMPVLTSRSAAYIRIGVESGIITDGKGTRQVDRNVLVNIRSGRVGRTIEDPQNDVDHGGPVFAPVKKAPPLVRYLITPVPPREPVRLSRQQGE